MFTRNRITFRESLFYSSFVPTGLNPQNIDHPSTFWGKLKNTHALISLRNPNFLHVKSLDINSSKQNFCQSTLTEMVNHDGIWPTEWIILLFTTGLILTKIFRHVNVNQCKSMLTYCKSGSHGVPDANLFNLTFLLVDFGKVLCSFANELQQISNAPSRRNIFPKYWLFCYRFIAFIFCLSFVNNS